MGTATPMPTFEGVLAPSRADAARMRAHGSQAGSFEGEGIQVRTFGRVRFKDRSLAELAERGGVAAALARGWEDSGDRVLEAVDGEYLVAVWCAARRRGLIAVDRFSSYPLFVGEHGGRLAFAMTPGAVCRMLAISEDVDPGALHAYAYFHAIPAPLSIFRGVSRLDLGQLLRIESGRVERVMHWTPQFVEDAPFDFRTEQEAFLAALRRGVSECVGGVPQGQVGCFLSGGTDSSTIAGLAARVLEAPVKTFSIGFDVAGYDERHYSRLAARHFGTDHTEHVLTPAEAESAIEVIATAYEQPFGNSSAVPTYVCARVAREAGVSRMLGGDGGDELYGGNERYATQWLFSLYDGVPDGLRSALIEPLLFGRLSRVGWWPIRKARAYVEQARVPLPDRLGAKYNLLNRFGLERVFHDELIRGGLGRSPIELEREVWARCAAGSQINRLLAYDFKFTLADNDLPKVTRMCHAAGTEVSFPMLTEAVTEHSLRLPPGQKLKRTRLRYFFREALRGFLPDEIIDKSKHGFGMPFGDWLLAQPRLAARAEDALDGLAHRRIIRREFLTEVRQALGQGHAGYYGTMVWVLMVLELWLRAHEPARHSEKEPA